MVIFLDAANLEDIDRLAHRVVGITTNPSLMKKEGIKNYRDFASSVLAKSGNKAVSFEVLATDENEMYRQAMEICSWGPEVFVKIPALTAGGSFPEILLRRLVKAGARLNVTAVMTRVQAQRVDEILNGHPDIISIFAGRVADTGVDPTPIFAKPFKSRTLWASVRQVYDVVRAEKAGADIITLPASILDKLDLMGKDLLDYSHETSIQFFNDGKEIAW